MAQRKKTKKKKTKKQQQQQEHLNFIILGLFFVLFGLFGLLKLGFLGTLIANGLRVIVGNTFPIAAVGLMLYGCSLIIYGKEFPIKKTRPMIGIVVLYLGVLLLMHAHLFRNVGTQDPAIIGTTWDFLQMDIKANLVHENVGGGMIGALLYSATYFLVSQFGSYLIATLLIVSGLFLLSMLEFQQVANGLQKIREKITQFTVKSQQNQEKKAAKRVEKKVAKQAKIEQLAQERIKNEVRERTPGEKLAQESLVEAADDVLEPEQLTLVQIDSFQNQATPQPSTRQVASSLESEQEEDHSELQFSIAEEAEDRDYELPSSTLLDSIASTDQSGEYQKLKKTLGF